MVSAGDWSDVGIRRVGRLEFVFTDGIVFSAAGLAALQLPQQQAMLIASQLQKLLRLLRLLVPLL